MPARIQTVYQLLGKVGIAFLLVFGTWIALGFTKSAGGFRIILQLGWLVLGIWLLIRLMRLGAKQAVWRLRHRLVITYLFIAVVPLLLIVGLGALGAYALFVQTAVNAVAGELDRRVNEIDAAAERIAWDRLDAGEVVPNPLTSERYRAHDDSDALDRMLNPYLSRRFPGLVAVLRVGDREVRYGAQVSAPAPGKEWSDAKGVLLREGSYYLWSHRKTHLGDITITAPIDRAMMDQLAPNLGSVGAAATPEELATNGLVPPAVNSFDWLLPAYASLPAWDWDAPGEQDAQYQILVLTRPSLVIRELFSRQALQGLVEVLLIVGLIVFVVVEIVCWVIGITMTRTITGAVHHLYEGTEKVMEGDFSHRIQVTGDDQLAQLGLSFNRMTENIQRLLAVAKEKERLQSEIEIAREVQNMLYPRALPQAKTLRLAAACHPARLVSGDYYDYELVRERQVAMAIGDVAGKGISAALLMATVQSSLRTQLQSSAEAMAAAADGTPKSALSTSTLVARLNQHLYANTSPEKYATFCLGLYDEPTGTFVYTNAGHVQPVLVRKGRAQRLDVNGTVVGAFPLATYDESRLILESGDLLVFFTDGMSEPENAFGEMFGEERLMDLLVRNADRDEARIMELAIESVREWTGSDELQDDMTLLLARRV